MVDRLTLCFIFYMRVKKLQIEGGHEGKAGWANGKARWALPTLKGLIISTDVCFLLVDLYFSAITTLSAMVVKLKWIL